jgi:hypothetical protein
VPRPKVLDSRNHTARIAAAVKHERPDLDPTDYLYLIYAQRLGRILDAVDEKQCQKTFGISAAEMRVLFALRRAGPSYALRPTELFRSILVTPGAITKQVDRLIAISSTHERKDCRFRPTSLWTRLCAFCSRYQRGVDYGTRRRADRDIYLPNEGEGAPTHSGFILVPGGRSRS